jgi:hypothetical protein
VKSAAETVLSHLSQASDAKFLVNQVQERGHDRTPLFDQCRRCWPAIISGHLRRLQKMASSARKIVSWEPVEEITSRVREASSNKQRRALPKAGGASFGIFASVRFDGCEPDKMVSVTPGVSVTP